ncbi:MAG: isoleucine--tRNA ligase [Candidatus Sericytochromatia bacterium]|nr:isoleucine--tRNA ligase [Candidatus Sericytochromatia bacterium]
MEPKDAGTPTTARDYKGTLNLPQTDFPMRANSAEREPDFQLRWDEMGLYKRMQDRRSSAPTFMLHDGPPYLSSPNIHIGHALNRTLKDIVVKFRSLSGHRAPFVPGYDCHGLPIEHAVLKDVEGGRHAMSPVELRNKCRSFAERNLAGQQSRFRRLGILADWDRPYLTMDPGFEARQVEVFGEMAQKGFIYRGLKPVYWCPTCETALAEAEIEYVEEFASPSIYVKFPLKATSQMMVGKLGSLSEPVNLVIWTTTPWTLPANLGISVHPRMKYVVLRTAGHGLLMLARDLVEAFGKETGISGEPVVEFVGAELEMLQAQHPFLPSRTSLVLLGEHVTADAGTGLVHTAPGHGVEDFEVGRKYQLPVFAPLNAQGVFTEEAGTLVAGLRYSKANPVVIKRLADTGFLLHEGTLVHAYPHCWRCHKPVIYRGTEQWFASVDGFRKAALEAIHDVRWIPASGERRIENMVANRSDWCISRQRTWGVPIPIFYCTHDNEPLLTPESVLAVKTRFAAEGSDAWWTRDVADLLPPGAACARCGGTSFRKEQDIMDVWFDSGSSHAAVLEARPELSWPADLYLEGTDQYRGWFQSSLLTSVSTRGTAPYRTVVTHGFAVDEHGRKMSKSLGNVVEPAKVIDAYGADILRLWVASVDYTSDVRISENILKQMAEIYRKIRNTARFALSNLYDFERQRDAVSVGELHELDRYALHRLGEVVGELTGALERYEFFQFYQLVQNYCVVDLSSFYFDIRKDALYAGAADSHTRRSCQTVLDIIVRTLAVTVAPVLSHLAEDIWQHLPAGARGETESVFLTDWPEVPEAWVDPILKARWEQVASWRVVALKALEQARQAKLIGSALDAAVTLYPREDAMRSHLQALGPAMLAQILIASEVSLAPEGAPLPAEAPSEAPLAVRVERASGQKCQRCWCYSQSVGRHGAHPTLCDRCVDVVDA